MRFILFLSFFLYSSWSFSFQVPAIKNHVNDYASMIDSTYESAINQLLAQVKKETGVEMAILTIDSLHGESIEQVCIQVADKWKLGTKKNDKGLLLLISSKDRELRLEIGQGLEGNIPDAYAKRIIDDNILPLFKAGKVNEGVLLGVYQSIKLAAPQYPIDQFLSENGKTNLKESSKSKTNKWIIILVCLFLIFVFPRSPFLTALFLGGSSHRRGGSFGSGGSFGGGGGFSGGGASGRW